MQNQHIEQAGVHNLPESYKLFPSSCPCCNNRIAIVGTRIDGQSSEVLEAHCNRCGLSYNPDGTYRALPTYTFLQSNQWLENALANNVPLMDYPKHLSYNGLPSIWANGRHRNLSGEI